MAHMYQNGFLFEPIISISSEPDIGVQILRSEQFPIPKIVNSPGLKCTPGIISYFSSKLFYFGWSSPKPL